MTYLENVTQTCIEANNFSRTQVASSAWDNKKTKSRNRYLPRGKVFQRLEKRARASLWDELSGAIITSTVTK